MDLKNALMKDERFKQITEKVQKEEQEKPKQEAQEKEKEKIKREQQEIENRNEYFKFQKELKRINDFRQKKPKFFTHLLHAYMPKRNIEQVSLDLPDNTKCCICKIKVVGLNHFLHNSVNEEVVLKKLQSALIGEEDNIFRDFVQKHGTLAFTGNNTDSYMCPECLKNFLNYIENNILLGDREINKIIRKKMKEEI